MSYITNNLIAFDQMANALLAGSPDETLSAAAWRMEQAGRWQGRVFRPLIDALFFFDPDHCRKAHEAERQGAQNHAIYRSQA